MQPKGGKCAQGFSGFENSDAILFSHQKKCTKIEIDALITKYDARLGNDSRPVGFRE